LPDIFL